MSKNGPKNPKAPQTSLKFDSLVGKSLYDYFMSPQAYQALRKLQVHIKKQLGSHGNIPSGVLSPNHLPEDIFIACKILVGTKGELIAVPISSQTELGSGSFGSVSYGIDLDTGKAVAVKEKKVANYDQERRRTLKEEVAVVDAHGKLVASIETSSAIYTVDELAMGTNYNQAIAPLRTREDPDACLAKLDMAIKFVQEVDRFHKKGWFHRDIKLANMMWDPDKRQPRLIDIDFAIPRNGKKSLKSLDKVGTPIYTSPEVMTPSKPATYSLRTELFACGIALIEMFRPAEFNDQHRLQWKQTPDDQLPIFYERLLAQTKQDSPPELKPVFRILQDMVQSNGVRQPSFSKVIKKLQGIKHKLEYKAFAEGINHQSKFSITPELLENPKISDTLTKAAQNDDSKVLDLVSPISSLYSLLLKAIEQRNLSAFKHIEQRFKLYAPTNKAYADIIFKKVNHYAKANPKDPFAKLLQELEKQRVIQTSFPIISLNNGQTTVEHVQVPYIKDLSLAGKISWPSIEHANYGQQLLAFRHRLVTTRDAESGDWKSALSRDIELVDIILRELVAIPLGKKDSKHDPKQIFVALLKSHAEKFSLLAVPQGHSSKFDALVNIVIPPAVITKGSRPPSITWGQKSDQPSTPKSSQQPQVDPELPASNKRKPR